MSPAPAHDGMARAISPIHTYTDGDVVFVAGDRRAARCRRHRRTASSARPSPRFTQLAPIIAAAADVVTRAIVHATLAATSAGDMRSYTDELPSALRP